MTDQQQTEDLDQVWEVRRRWVGIVAFLFGAGVVLGFFGFWPGLPHVVDWGAVLVAVLVGAVARWAAQRWVNRLARRKGP
ncbi:hypothetical protein [Streptomyces sp. PanSC9]|uniref:hypothetical protein n=1 Tax=Streptomyces sp. PanSC9 TaxID=1520461 RepID=UPI000F4A2E1F|nr:hypothetical protein [Streptomyces sp. PanSC9]ROP53565.1 hypothetical protein EDD94_3076 [Streptomyces sp. PanSC9]